MYGTRRSSLVDCVCLAEREHTSQKLSGENLIRNYLLRKLPENEQDEFEKQLLVDPKLFKTSCIIENELLDDYVMGSLSESDRMNLESGPLMGAQHQRRVQLIRQLHLKSKTLVSVKKRSVELSLLFTQYFRLHKSGLGRAA